MISVIKDIQQAVVVVRSITLTLIVSKKKQNNSKSNFTIIKIMLGHTYVLVV